MRTLGYSIALDICNQDKPRDTWLATSIVIAWYEASGRNIKEFEWMSLLIKFGQDVTG